MYSKIAIMQPYLFPYIGYFSMIKHVDAFVFLDDVNYIKSGWINRNKLVFGDKDFLFSIPIKKASQNVRIMDTFVNSDEIAKFLTKLRKTLEINFPGNDSMISEIERLILSSDNISDICQNSIKHISEILNLKCDFLKSSDMCVDFESRSLRLINICKYLGAEEYINSIGGTSLYSKDEFLNHGIKLSFLKSNNPMGYKSSLQLMLENNFCGIDNYELI